MQQGKFLGLLIASLGLISSTTLGCSQQVSPKVAQSPAPATDSTSSASAASPANDSIAQSPAASPAAPERRPDVVYVPTPEVVVQKMLDLAQVKKTDILYDLGSGDGRIVITAAQKIGTRGIGIDIDPERIRESNENAKKAGVTDRVKFLQQDLFTTDLREATVVTLYLLPTLNVKLRPKLFKELKPGTRIVSHDFDMGEWKPEQVVKVKGPQREHTVYFWRIPETVPANLR